MPTPPAPRLPAEAKIDRRTPLPGLTALRFFAATYVLLFHFLPRHPADPSHPDLLTRWIDAGFTGVSTFFILSGFILAYTHPRVPDLRRFFRARFARVYPLYLLAFLWSAEPFLRDLFSYHRWPQLWALPADLLLVQDWFPSLALVVNVPAWTLSCEAFFYLLFPFCVRPLARFSRRPLLPLLALWLLELLPPILTHTVLVTGGPDSLYLMHGFLLSPAARLGEFFAGIVLGLHFLERQNRAAQTPRLPAWFLPTSLVLCLAALSLNGRVPHEVMRNGLMIGPYLMLIWALACSRSPVLAGSLLQLGGEVSYGVYLLQMPYAHTLSLAVNHLPAALRHQQLWIATIFPVAWLTYTYVEKPCRSLLLGHRPTPRDKPIPTPQPQLP